MPVLLFLLIIVNLATAQDTVSQKQGSTINRYVDMILRTNPDGIMAIIGMNYQRIYKIDSHYNIPSNELKIGGNVGINPTYGQFSLYSEWLPLVFLRLRLQYDKYVFLGQYGGLLSFSSADQPFGDTIIDNRSGDEEKVMGDRIILNLLLRAKLGNIIFRNQSTMARYYFYGKGPYFLEWEYDTLLKNNDMLYANDFSLLYEIKFNQKTQLFIGPYHEWVYAKSSKLTRQRIGLNLFLESNKWQYFKSQRIYCRVGTNLEDRNRDGEIFALFGFGVDF